MIAALSDYGAELVRTKQAEQVCIVMRPSLETAIKWAHHKYIGVTILCM